MHQVVSSKLYKFNYQIILNLQFKKKIPIQTKKDINSLLINHLYMMIKIMKVIV